MSTKITTCTNCKSRNITEINPENRNNKTPICEIDCICNDCDNKFIIKSWTIAAKKRGILY